MKRFVCAIIIVCLLCSAFPVITLANASCPHEYIQITYEPTCTVEGFTLHLCKLCGSMYRDSFFSPLGHDYLGGYIANGGCTAEYYERCERCHDIRDETTPYHDYIYGQCWFCSDPEPNATYTPTELLMDGAQVMLVNGSYALGTSLALQEVSMDGDAIVCPPSEQIWTMHRAEDGFILRRDLYGWQIQELTATLQLEEEGSIWTPVPTDEAGVYLFCSGGCYLALGSKGWYTTSNEKFADKIKLYSHCEHELLEPAVKQEATCKQEGIMQRRCVKCADYCEESIPVEPHCYENGKCRWCEKVESAGHIWSEPVRTTEASCTQGAKEYRTCSHCDESCVAFVSEPNQHTHELLYVRERSCTATNAECYGCPCGRKLIWEHLSEGTHRYSDWVVIDEEPCIFIKWKSTCVDCGDERYKDRYGADHDFGQWELGTMPDCTQDGSIYMQCAICAEKETRTVEAFGHEFVNEEPALDCELGGNVRYCCRHCDLSYGEVQLPKPHTYEDGVCTACGKVYACVFTDVPADAWYRSAVEFADQNYLMNGMSATTFEPDTTMNRAMLVTVLWRYAGSVPADGAPFTDVEDGQWYTEAVAWAASNGIVNGIAEGIFDPNGMITRQQLATILYRFSTVNAVDTTARADLSTYPDGEKVSTWAADAISWAVAEGLINGVQDGEQNYLDPLDSATRAQGATILMRYIERIAS